MGDIIRKIYVDTVFRANAYCLIMSNMVVRI